MLDLQSQTRTTNNDELDFINRLKNLDLEPIIFRVMNMEETKWSLEKADIVAQMYRCFLYLVKKYPGKVIVPNKAVDQFWHQHILDTEKYHQDCQEVFGYFMHHFPYFGMRGENDKQVLDAAFGETLALLKEQFGDTPIFGDKKASDCLFLNSADIKASDCLFGDFKTSSTDLEASDCLFGDFKTNSTDLKAGDCLFEDIKANSTGFKAGNCLFGKYLNVNMSRPRPIRN